MEKIKEYFKLLRIKHYLKNILVFVPVLVNGQLSQIGNLKWIMVGFISFCLLSSAVYCFNDIKDYKKDKEHPIKILYENGVKLTINTDDLLIFDSSIENEYFLLYEAGTLSAKQLDEIRMNGLKG